jgi:hypothetical protein
MLTPWPLSPVRRRRHLAPRLHPAVPPMLLPRRAAPRQAELAASPAHWASAWLPRPAPQGHAARAPAFGCGRARTRSFVKAGAWVQRADHRRHHSNPTAHSITQRAPQHLAAAARARAALFRHAHGRSGRTAAAPTATLQHTASRSARPGGPDGGLGRRRRHDARRRVRHHDLWRRGGDGGRAQAVKDRRARSRLGLRLLPFLLRGATWSLPSRARLCV